MRCSPISTAKAREGFKITFSYSLLCASNHSLLLFLRIALKKAIAPLNPLNSMTRPLIF